MQQEIFVHDEERADFQFVFHAAHDIEQFVSCLEEVDEFSFAAEEGGGGAKVAAHRATDRGNDGGRGRAFALGQTDAHDARLHTRDDGRMTNRGGLVLAQIAAHPGDPLTAHDVVSVDHLLDARDGGHVSADYDDRTRRKLAGHAAHLAHLGDVHDDRRDTDDVILLIRKFLGKAFARRKVEYRAGRGDVFLDHHDAPGAMKHAQRKTALRTRDLVVIKLHRVDGAAAEFVILRVRAED